MKIPVSVIIATRNEEKKLETCIGALRDFEEIVVVDSQSQDKTIEVAQSLGVRVVEFIWNKQYPKKRQWCLDNLSLKHDWIIFVDADEIATSEFIKEVRYVFTTEPACSGYFVRGYHILNGKVLRHGLQNNKLVLFDRRKIEFSIIDDLDIPGMGEMEGHYQPVLKTNFKQEQIGQIKNALLHDALDDPRAWIFRHQKYARWESGMNERNAWPDDPNYFRNGIKKHLRMSRYRPQLVFFISYFLLFGFLDGRRGLKFARMKQEYYTLIK